MSPARLLFVVMSCSTLGALSVASGQTPGHDSLAFVTVAAGGSFACALTRDGAAYCWGFGRFGQLGGGDTASSAVPRAVAGGYHFTSISAGRFHACALSADSLAYCWGDNSTEQVGNDSGEVCSNRKDPRTFACSVRPRPVSGDHRFAQISSGALHACGVTASGDAYCWGSNGPATLGSEGAPAASSRPLAVGGNLHFASVSGGLNHACGVTTAGALYCWGVNEDNQLGNDSVKASRRPMAIASAVTFTAVTAGGSHTCAIAADTTAYCWGEFTHGRLGIGASAAQKLSGKQHQATPAAVDGHRAFRSLSAGGVDTCGIGTDGRAYCWGDNFGGRLGVGGSFLTSRPWNTKPTPVQTDLKFTTISAGDYHSCAITTDGAVYCWGANDEGQLGDGTTKAKNKPVRVASP